MTSAGDDAQAGAPDDPGGSEQEHPGSWRRWLPGSAAASRYPPRYGALLLILLSGYLFSAFSHQRWVATLNLGLFTMVGLLATRNSPVRSAAGRAAITAGLIFSAVMIGLTASLSTDAGRAAAALWTAILLLLVVSAVIRQVLLLPTVTIQSIYGAISAYLMIGLMFATIYSFLYYLHGMSFFVNGEPGNNSTFQYFSFTTLTTLGYGDFTATHSGGRAIAMIEAMTGQIFLATLVARLVSAFRPSSRQTGTREPPADRRADRP